MKTCTSTISINENYYLLLTIDFEENNFNKIIMEKIIPLIKEERKKEILILAD